MQPKMHKIALELVDGKSFKADTSVLVLKCVANASLSKSVFLQ